MSEAIVRFWGVRGSIATPLTSKDIGDKIFDAFEKFSRYAAGKEFSHAEIANFATRMRDSMPHTYGGNTSCVELRYGDQIFVLDMGTGLRPFGNSIFMEMLKKKGIAIIFILSHVHWDHIQGLPFLGELYINKATGIENQFLFLGGTDWQKTAEIVLHGQMDPPTFPVPWREIMKITNVRFGDMHDMRTVEMDGVQITFRKLNHPQETYGSRFVLPNGRIITYTTDNEPYDPEFPDPPLLALAKDADVWIQDAQYSKDQYNGFIGGVPRHGWGHAYPEANARAAVLAGVKKLLLFHHDPGSSDAAIKALEVKTQELVYEYGGTTEVVAAWEGLELKV